MMPTALIDQIENAKRLACWLHDRTNDSTMPNDARHQVALSLFQLSLDVADAAIVLLDRNLPGPALMLSRSLIESYARGVWALRCAEDHEIDSFLKNGRPCPWRLGKLAATLKNRAPDQSAWVLQMTERLNPFHDLAHGGRLHVLARVGADSIEPNYPVGQLEALVAIGIEVLIRTGVELLALMGDEGAMEELADLACACRGQ